MGDCFNRGEKMKIEILGTGCPKCKEVEKIVKKVVEEMSIKASIEKVEDIEKIIERGVMMTPAIAVDGKIKISGKVPKEEEIIDILKEK